MPSYTPITEDHFKVIYTANMPNRVDLQEFLDLATHSGISGIRWPGGTLAETGFQSESSKNYYDLTAAELMENRSGSDLEVAGISDMLDLCISKNLSLSLIIPTLSYASEAKGGSFNEPNLNVAYNEYYLFLKNLLIEKKWGDLPDNFSIEIGNEASLHFGENQNTYGKIANTFLKAYDAVISEFDTPDSLNISIQMGISQDQETNGYVIHQIEDDLAHYIDSVRNHELNKNHGLSWDKGWAGLHDAAKIYFEEWIEKTGKNTETLDHYVSAWNTGTPTQRDSSGIIIPPNPAVTDYGMKELSAVVEMYANFSLLGVDQAAHWGVAVSQTHPNYTSAIDKDGTAVFSPKAEALRLIESNLVGTTIAHEFTKDQDGNQLRNGHFRSTADMAIDPESARVFVFEDDSKYVIFIAANRFETKELDHSLSLTVDLSNYLSAPDKISFAWSEQITTSTPVFSFADTLLSSKVQSERHSILFSEYSFTVDLSQNYELAMVTIKKEGVGFSNLDLWGTGESDFLSGGHGNDLIEGNSGNDVLISRGGDDLMIGGSGSDILIGGSGKNFFSGGVGSDVFSLSGALQVSTISDFCIDSDLIDISQWSHFGSREELAIDVSGSSVIILLNEKYIILENQLVDQNYYENLLNRIILDAGKNQDIEDQERYSYSVDGEKEIDMGAAGHSDIFGSRNDDFLFGGEGDDRFFGGDGADVVFGNSGNDLILGDSGADIISGGSGDNVLLGGEGHDTFIFSGGNDTIMDYDIDTDLLIVHVNTEDAENPAPKISETASGTLLDFGQSGSIFLSSVFEFSVNDIAFT